MVNADAKIVAQQLLSALSSIEGNHKDASSQQIRHQTVQARKQEWAEERIKKENADPQPVDG